MTKKILNMNLNTFHPRDMSVDELKDCMNMPLRTYKDFKSQDYIYKIELYPGFCH